MTNMRYGQHHDIASRDGNHRAIDHDHVHQLIESLPCRARVAETGELEETPILLEVE